MARIKTSEIPDPRDPSRILKSPTGKVIRRPLLKVELLGPDGDSLFDTQALVDSGADITMVDAEYALSLGVDLSKVGEIEVNGIYNEPVKARLGEITIRIPNMKMDLTLPALFVHSKNVNVLLGREGFFEACNVRFCHSKTFFDLKKA